MTTATPVPADIDADRLLDLVADCRELGPVCTSPFHAPRRVPTSRDLAAISISPLAVELLDGMPSYGG